MVSKAILIGLIVGAFVLVSGSYADLQKFGEILDEFKQKLKAPGEHFRNKLAGTNGNFDVNFKIGGLPQAGFRSSIGQQNQGYGIYYPPQNQGYVNNYYPQQNQGYGSYYPPQNQGYGNNYYPQQNQGFGNYYPPQNQINYYPPQNQIYGNYNPPQNQGYGNYYPAQQGQNNGLIPGYGGNGLNGYNPGYQVGYVDPLTQAGYHVQLGGAQQQGYGNGGYNPGYQPGYVDSSTQTGFNIPLGGAQQPGVGSNVPVNNGPIGTGGISGSSSGSIQLGNKPVTGNLNIESTKPALASG